MISDICLSLYNIDYDLEIIKYRQSHYFNNYQNFLNIRTDLFNFIIQLSMNYPISEASLFLTFNIFDRYASIESINNNELLIIIACLVLAFKYTETCVFNLNELCMVCDQKFKKD